MKSRLLLFALATVLLATPFVFANVANAADDGGSARPVAYYSEATSLSDAALFGSKSTPRFCDDSGTPPSSASCKTKAAALGHWKCKKGYFATDKNCNPLGTPCVGLTGQPGQWCDCSYNCKKKSRTCAFDIDPVGISN